jgi:hypothetical protein
MPSEPWAAGRVRGGRVPEKKGTRDAAQDQSHINKVLVTANPNQPTHQLCKPISTLPKLARLPNQNSHISPHH